MQRDKNAIRSLYWGGGVMPIMLLTGQATGQIYKHFNPDGVDINNGLAYLRQTLLTGLIAGILTGLLAVMYAFRALRGQDRDLAVIGLILALSPIPVFIAIAVIQVIFPV